MEQKTHNWVRKWKGTPERGAWIYARPDVCSAVIENKYGVRYMGEYYPSLADGLAAAEATIKH
jgi:hypothetical protein